MPKSARESDDVLEYEPELAAQSLSEARTAREVNVELRRVLPERQDLRQRERRHKRDRLDKREELLLADEHLDDVSERNGRSEQQERQCGEEQHQCDGQLGLRFADAIRLRIGQTEGDGVSAVASAPHIEPSGRGCDGGFRCVSAALREHRCGAEALSFLSVNVQYNENIENQYE